MMVRDGAARLLTMRTALLLALALLAIDGAWAQRPSVLIQPPRWVPISRAMVREQLCLTQSRARTTQEASAHALRCNLRLR
jgi:hypothetical protein